MSHPVDSEETDYGWSWADRWAEDDITRELTGPRVPGNGAPREPSQLAKFHAPEIVVRSLNWATARYGPARGGRSW